MKFKLSNEIHTILAFTYWESKTNEINTSVLQLPLETITSKGLKLGLDFLLLKIYKLAVTLTPSISIENISKANSGVFAFGTSLNLSFPFLNDRVNLVSKVWISKRCGTLQFRWRIQLLIFNYSLGIEFSILRSKQRIKF